MKSRPVISTSKDGKEERYMSVKEAAKAVGVNPGTISWASATTFNVKGKKWRYADGN